MAKNNLKSALSAGRDKGCLGGFGAVACLFRGTAVPRSSGDGVIERVPLLHDGADHAWWMLRHFIIPDLLSLPAIPIGIAASAVVVPDGDWLAGVTSGLAGAFIGGEHSIS
jgi:hypothetical protein